MVRARKIMKPLVSYNVRFVQALNLWDFADAHIIMIIRAISAILIKI